MLHEQNFEAFPISSKQELLNQRNARRIEQNRQRQEWVRRNPNQIPPWVRMHGYGSFGWGWSSIADAIRGKFNAPIQATQATQPYVQPDVQPNVGFKLMPIASVALTSDQTAQLNFAIDNLNQAIGKLNAVRSNINSALGIRLPVM